MNSSFHPWSPKQFVDRGPGYFSSALGQFVQFIEERAINITESKDSVIKILIIIVSSQKRYIGP